MTGPMKLRFNPLQVFEGSRSPAGLYARQKWLGEADTPAWQQDFQRTVSDLLDGQDHAGSWDQSVLQTIQRLFGLHLTVRDPAPPILRGLDWLMDRAHPRSPRMKEALREEIRTGSLRGLPFTRGRYDLFVCGATLFLCAIFGGENHTDVLAAYDWLANVLREDGRWGGWPSSNNVLRAFVVHPHYSRSPETTKAVEALGRVQDDSGKWADHIPFHQTVNALAHLDSTDADTQLSRAFKRLYRTQNADGTWGRTDREWKTFLTIHALKNKEKLALSPV